MNMNLYDKIKEYEEFSCKPKSKKYKEGTIFDENKSVKWNREEVNRLNDIYNEEVKELNRKKNAMYNEVYNDIIEYIIKETNVKKNMAIKIYDYVYSKYHAFGICNTLIELDDLLDIFQ